MIAKKGYATAILMIAGTVLLAFDVTEQAFAELNGAYVKFIEDAARLLYGEFNSDARIKDFEIACIHLESLHSHDAVSVICKGRPGGFKADFSNFGDLIC